MVQLSPANSGNNLNKPWETTKIVYSFEKLPRRIQYIFCVMAYGTLEPNQIEKWKYKSWTSRKKNHWHVSSNKLEYVLAYNDAFSNSVYTALVPNINFSEARGQWLIVFINLIFSLIGSFEFVIDAVPPSLLFIHVGTKPSWNYYAFDAFMPLLAIWWCNVNIPPQHFNGLVLFINKL